MDDTLRKKQELARDDIIGHLNRLLLGPMEQDEVIRDVPRESKPTDYYLTGILWPRNQELDPEEDVKLDNADAGKVDTAAEEEVPLFTVFRPSAIGLTCTVSTENTAFEIIARGARYVRVIERDGKEITDDTDQQTGSDTDRSTDESRDIYNWKRKPFEYHISVSSDEAQKAWRTNEFMSPDGKTVRDEGVSIYVKRRLTSEGLVITASLINTAQKDALNENCIFQSELEICSAVDGCGNIIARRQNSSQGRRTIESNDLLYRSSREFASGHAVSVVWDETGDSRTRSVRTSWIPSQKVWSISASGHESLSSLQSDPESPFGAELLSDSSNKELMLNNLNIFCDYYESWIGDQHDRIKGLDAEYTDVARENIIFCRDAVRRMKEGVKVLTDSPLAFQAFCYANEVMNNQSKSKKNGPDASRLVWRPFQLAFILLTIPSIVDRGNPDRETMDLLWFPTGGGKTEAYLGLTAFTIFFRRLKSHGKEQGCVDVLMRYTLRLLTVQQFQRAAAMICAADQIRKKKVEILGQSRISIGLFVGQDATPNKLLKGKTNAKEALQEERKGGRPKSTPRLLLSCPLCGAELKPDAYVINEAVPEMEIVCPDADCPSKGQALPVHTVDEDIYRVRPSLVIGTVDKFAQLPRKTEQAFLFGIGAQSAPELIIQDELHLISGPLGTITGLYETLIDLLCAREGHRIKIIGSTATIGRATEQVLALFDRSVMQFPPPAIDYSDSFFSVEDRIAPDRVYLGLSSSGRSPKFTLQALSAAVLTAAQYLKDSGNYSESEIDPYWTLLGYFNSLRELGGADVMMRDDVPRSIDVFANRLACDPRELNGQTIELTSRVPSTRIPEILNELLFRLDGDPFEGEAVDIVLASNMISVGMDIPRLGQMIVYGQPKSTSEYIQATSRVGRGLPGIIMTVFNASRPRDASHFEHFKGFHQALYRKVEATSVTPWSARARDKALHAILISAVRYLAPGMIDRFSAMDLRADSPAVKDIMEKIVDRSKRAGLAFCDPDEVRNDLTVILEKWESRIEYCRRCNKKLEYWATVRPYKNIATHPHLMRSAEEEFDPSDTWPTPNSMREVEPSSYFTESKE